MAGEERIATVYGRATDRVFDQVRIHVDITVVQKEAKAILTYQYRGHGFSEIGFAQHTACLCFQPCEEGIDQRPGAFLQSFSSAYGPEYISETLRKWAEKRSVTIQHIQPGQPQQNAYVERYNRTVRHEWLDQYIIESIEEAQDQATQWLWTYNNDRPKMGIGGITPVMKLNMAA